MLLERGGKSFLDNFKNRFERTLNLISYGSLVNNFLLIVIFLLFLSKYFFSATLVKCSIADLAEAKLARVEFILS